MRQTIILYSIGQFNTFPIEDKILIEDVTYIVVLHDNGIYHLTRPIAADFNTNAYTIYAIEPHEKERHLRTNKLLHADWQDTVQWISIEDWVVLVQRASKQHFY